MTVYKTLLALVLALGALSPTLAKAEEIAKTFDGAAVKRVHVEQAVGNVAVRVTDARAATVRATKVRFDEGCSLAIEMSGGDLRVVNKAPEAAPPKRCEVTLHIDVPRGTLPVAYDLTVGAGDVQVMDARGELTFKVGSGNVTVAGSDLSQIDGRSGSGDVSLSGGAGLVDLKIGAGDADVTMSQAPTRGHLNMRLGAGNAVVRLPKEARIKSSFKSGMGSMTNEFVDHADAKFSISGAAGAGDLSIRKM